MPIYSKSGKHYSHDFQYKGIKTLDQVDYSDEVIFYHHPYDRLQSGIPLYDALDEKNWQYLRDNPKVKLFHNNDSETFEIFFVDDVEKTINDRKINPNQLHIAVMDENHKEFLEKHLSKRNISGVNINVDNYLLSNVTHIDGKLPSTHKFSSLSRNYRIWRLYVFSELVKRNLIENFNYSFHNIHPYNDPPKVIPLETMQNDLLRMTGQSVPKVINKWLKQCPHELSSNNEVRNKWSNVTYDTIRASDFHLVIETHFDQKEFFSGNKEYSRDFSPSSITEKCYKSIACLTPFIVFSTPFYLQDLRNLGFKTYSPFINEHYDTETDSVKRLNMIVDEINRICALSDNDYRQLVNNCKTIAEENLRILKAKQDDQSNLSIRFFYRKTIFN